MKTFDQFLKRFHCHLAGLALLGTASDRKDTPLDKGARALEIPAETRALLKDMFDYLYADDEPLPATPRNGVAPMTRKDGK